MFLKVQHLQCLFLKLLSLVFQLLPLNLLLNQLFALLLKNLYALLVLFLDLFYFGL